MNILIKNNKFGKFSEFSNKFTFPSTKGLSYSSQNGFELNALSKKAILLVFLVVTRDDN